MSKTPAETAYELQQELKRLFKEGLGLEQSEREVIAQGELVEAIVETFTTYARCKMSEAFNLRVFLPDDDSEAEDYDDRESSD